MRHSHNDVIERSVKNEPLMLQTAHTSGGRMGYPKVSGEDVGNTPEYNSLRCRVRYNWNLRHREAW